MLTMYKDDMVHQNTEITMTGVSFSIVDKYKDTVYRAALATVGNPHDAEDIMQEVFFKYFRLQPKLKNEQHEKAWLLRVTINEGKNLKRSVWFRNRTTVDFRTIPDSSEEPREMSPVLEAVLSLPVKYRTVIYLYYYEEYAVRQIAEITAQTEAAVSKQLSRGRNMLQKKLGGTNYGHEA